MSKMKEEIDKKELGRRLQAVRNQLGLKQTDIARKIGVSSLTISRMERGEDVHSDTLISVLTIYAPFISLNALFTNDFPDNVKDVFKENRIELPTSFLVEQMEQMVKIKKDMEAAFDYERNSLLPRLEKTINLL